MRKIINFFKKINDLAVHINKLNSEVKINNNYMSKMLVENRILLKKVTNQKLNVILIAFEPATWAMFQSIYDTFSKSDRVNITVLVIPYAHSTLPIGTYKDDGLREYLDELKIPYIYGYNADTDTWLDLFNLHPDYVFYQAPYNGIYPETLRSGYVCQFAQICHIPYGTALISGDIENTIYPIDFFTDVSYFFLETEANKETLLEHFRNKHYQLLDTKINVVGSLKVETIYKKLDLNNHSTGSVTILWLPRWNTKEGICTFFDYYKILIDYIDMCENMRLIFRPHPLMFTNFIKTGEMNNKDIENIRKKFSTDKFYLDENEDYVDSFNKADILISDPTSLMYEFFVTLKPIIYTQKKENVFNQLGCDLLQCYYCVKNADELKNILDNLMINNDSLLGLRKHLLTKYFKYITTVSENVLRILV